MTGRTRIASVLTGVAVALVTIGAAVHSARAASITVNNFSFEDTTSTSPPTDWSISSGTAFRSRTYGGATDGSRTAWINSPTTGYQDTGVVIELGKTYTLTVDITTRGFAGSVGTFRLYGSTAGYGTAIGTPAAEASATAATSEIWLLNQSVSFTATAAEAGQTLGIAISTTAGVQTEWDNIRLDTGSDTTPPTIAGLSPLDNANPIPRGDNLVVTFNENVTNGAGNIVIKETVGDAVFETIPASAGNVSFSGPQATIDPSNPFATNTGYYVLIETNAIADSKANYFAGITNTTTWNFTSGGVIANASFELDGTQAGATPTAWTSVNGSLGTRTGGAGLSPTDGSYELWLNNGNTIYQDTGTVVQDGETYTLTVDASTTFGGTETATFRLYGSAAGFGTALGGAQSSIVPAQGVWSLDQTTSFTATGAEAGQTLGIALATTTGTQTEWDNIRLEVGAFVDMTPPTVGGLSPLDNAIEVLRGADLVVTFNESVTNGTGNIVIKETVGDAVFETIPASAGNVTFSGAVVTIDPSNPFTTNTGYYVLIETNAITDMSTNSFAGITNSTTWNFTSAGLVANPSFEAGSGGPSFPENPLGWSASSAQFRPRSSAGALTPTDGSSQAWMNNGTYAYQDTGWVIVNDETYTLKVDIGHTPGWSNVETMVIRLYGSDAGEGTALAEITPSVGAEGTWSLDQTVAFTATPSEATGQTLGIYIGVTSGTQAEWDNVRLTITGAPPPAGTVISIQ